MNITKPQMEALKLVPEGYLLARGRYGNLYAELAKKGLMRFEGYQSGKRKFSLTDAGRRVIVDTTSSLSSTQRQD